MPWTTVCTPVRGRNVLAPKERGPMENVWKPSSLDLSFLIMNIYALFPFILYCVCSPHFGNCTGRHVPTIRSLDTGTFIVCVRQKALLLLLLFF